MDSSHDDLSLAQDASYDRSFGADRHDLRTYPIAVEEERPGLMGLAAHAVRRILRRAPDAPANDGAALSRVAGGNSRNGRLSS